MNQFDYIHVALHGHFDNKLSVRYTFNGSADGTPRWEGSLPDPDAIVRNFVSARECYVMWHNTHGHYYGVITTDPFDARAGRVMLTLMVSDGDAVAGRAVFSALSALKKAFLEDRQMTDETVRQVLLSVDFPQTPRHLKAWEFDAAKAAQIPAASVKPLCYRTYLSTRELETVFSFPDQAEYDRYIYKVVITATASLRPGVAVDRLTAPVKKVYTVICPEGVEASKEIVAEGDHITLTFNKGGYTPRKESFTVGTISPYVRTEGSALIVKAPEESGMGFTRRIRVNVRSSKGTMVNGYTISVNDRPVDTMEPYITLTESDLKEGRIEIQVASNNFRPFKKVYQASELANESTVDLVLVPVEEGIVLRLDFGEGRVFEEQISIEKNTPEYSQLHSGNFHGFRAHRQGTQGEVYNVDVRSSSKPVAPSFDRASTASTEQQSTGGRVVPHFEKVEPAKKKDRIDMTMPGRQDAEKEAVEKPKERKKPFVTSQPGRDSADKGDGEGQGFSKKLRIICLIVCIVAIILGAVYIIAPLIGSDPDAAKAEGEAAQTENVDESVPQGDEEAQAAAAAASQAGTPAAAPAPEKAAPAAPGEPTADEKADYDYFNKNEVWKRGDLRSDAGRRLYDALVEGNIDAIASSEYFVVEGRATNKKAVKMIEWAWASKGTRNQPGNEKAIRKNVSADRADIANAYEDVARNRPAEPNTTPRPSRK